MTSRETLKTEGWLFHFGHNKHGRQFCNLRYTVLLGTKMSFYKYDLLKDPDQKPDLEGPVEGYHKWEELGRIQVKNHGLYAFKIWNRLETGKDITFGAKTQEDVARWMEALQRARDDAIRQAQAYAPRSSRSSAEDDGYRNDKEATSSSRLPSLTRRESIGLGLPSILTVRSSEYLNGAKAEPGDTSASNWHLSFMENGLRFFEDDSPDEKGKMPVMKTIGVVDAQPEAIFHMVMSIDSSTRKEFDSVTRRMKLLETVDGHTDIVYYTTEPRLYDSESSPRDFCVTRYWRREQDGTYLVFVSSSQHTKCPDIDDYKRGEVTIESWEIVPLPSTFAGGPPRSLVEQLIGLDLKSNSWSHRKPRKVHQKVIKALLSRVAGLREYFAAHPEKSGADLTLTKQSMARLNSSNELGSSASSDVLESQTSRDMFHEMGDEFFDTEEPQEEMSEMLLTAAGQQSDLKKHTSFKVVASAVYGLALRPEDLGMEGELCGPEVAVNEAAFEGTLPPASPSRPNCSWSTPEGDIFCLRGKTYLQDGVKIKGGEPLLKLVAVDWFKGENRMDRIAAQKWSFMQTPEAKAAPFVLICNLQVPGTPHYSMAFYFVAKQKIRRRSLLDNFVNGDDVFRNSRFKLIPSIKEGPWVVKRAVGSKAVLLGRALTTTYLRQDNFLEMDVDVGSSSIARSIIGLVIGYITSLVVDMAICIQGEKEEGELPEYILGCMRVHRVELEAARQFGAS